MNVRLLHIGIVTLTTSQLLDPPAHPDPERKNLGIWAWNHDCQELEESAMHVFLTPYVVPVCCILINFECSWLEKQMKTQLVVNHSVIQQRIE